MPQLLEMPDALVSLWGSKNQELFHSGLRFTATQKIWWKCRSVSFSSHEYCLSLRDKLRGRGCGICAGKIVEQGVNDLTTLAPDILPLWDYKKNQFSPQTVTSGSHKKAWWVCQLGHEWEAQIIEVCGSSSRCPYCANKKVLSGFNDLATKNPFVATEWDYKKNFPVQPEEVLFGSMKKFAWLCSEGHSWLASPQVRRSHGCSVCSAKSKGVLSQVPKRGKSLKDVAPHLQKVWSLNNSVRFEDVSFGSSVPRLWLCDQGHETLSLPKDRVAGHGCKECFHFSSTSLFEKEVEKLVEAVNVGGYKVFRNSRQAIAPHELDFYIPDLNLAIECNGLYWHSDVYKEPDYHYDKWLACKNKELALFNVWEDDWLFHKDKVFTHLEALFIPYAMDSRADERFADVAEVKVENGSFDEIFLIKNRWEVVEITKAEPSKRSSRSEHTIWNAGYTIFSKVE